MQYISTTCANCNAVLQADRSKSVITCPYCGTIFTVKYENNELSGSGREMFVVRAGLLCQYNGASATPVIPDTVVKLIQGVFSNLPIFEITLPDSVRIIGNKVFERCNSLTSVTIPDSASDLGYWIFDECANLNSVVMPRFFRDNTGKKRDITHPSAREEILGHCPNLQVIRNSSGDLLWSREYEVIQRKREYETQVLFSQLIQNIRIWAIVSISTSWLPLLGFTFGIITLIKTNKAIQTGVNENIISNYRVISILAIFINAVATPIWFFS